MHPATEASPVDAGRDALARGAWSDARAAFEGALASAAEDGDPGRLAAAYEGLAWAAMWLLDVDTLFDARLQAYRHYRAAGDRAGAARAAMWLGSDHDDFHGDVGAADGWYRRARRLLHGRAASPEHAWLAVLEASHLVGGAGDAVEARRLGAIATQIGQAADDPQLELIGLATEGRALVAQGDVAGGVALLDEAAAVAQAEQVAHSVALAWSFCYLISACELLYDYERAAQWCARAEEIARRQGLPFMWGLCRTRYAGVLVMQGEWAAAEGQLDEAVDALRRTRPHWSGEATLRLGELRRRQGRLAEARELFAQVEQEPEALAGLGRIALDGGDAVRARELAEHALRTLADTCRTERAGSLQLLAEACAALGDLDGARGVLAELDALAVTTRTGSIAVLAAFAGGVTAAAAGHLDDARRRFEDAVTAAERARLPYEAARARLELAAVLDRLGRTDAAGEIAARARDELRRLGADVESGRAGVLAARAGGLRLTPREREVLTLVARGLGDREIAAELVLSEHTVHRHVANVLARLDCPTRAAAVARATAAGLIIPRP